jgi:Flp pilus assembly protein TadG
MRSFLSDRRASVAVTFGVATIPLLLGTGVAVDYGKISRTIAALQESLDLAVLAGAAYRHASDQQRIEEAHIFFDTNFVAPWDATASFTADGDPTRGLVATVRGTAHTSVPMAFMGIIGIHEAEITVTAAARGVIGPPICMLALDTTVEHGLDIQGTTDFDAIDCAVHTNSDSPRALNQDGGATGDADIFCAAGGYEGINWTPEPFTRCGTVPDPFADLPMPNVLGCDDHNAMFINGTYVISPGVYCGGLRTLAGADVTLLPGVYVIKDGDLELQSGSTIHGEDVTFYFYGHDAHLNHHSGALIDITAPETGDFRGIAMTQHAASSVGEVSTLSGGPDVRIVGSLHFPTQPLEIAGGADFANISPYMPMIAHSFIVTGNGVMTVQVDLDATGYEDQLAHAADGVILIE